MEENKKLIFKVSSKSNVHSLSTAIAKTYLEGQDFEIHSIGEMSNNQATKSIARACQLLSGKGKDVYVKIFFWGYTP
jgi:stage V sporulation protein SpoVS